MNEEGICTLWVKNVDEAGEASPAYLKETQVEQERQVVIMHVVTENGMTIDLCFRRTDLSAFLAFPNEADHAIEVAVNIEESA